MSELDLPGDVGVDAHLLELALSAARDGVVICDARDPGLPLIYVNPAFEQMTGYDARYAMGRNCRFLRGDDHDQEALLQLRSAIEAGDGCTVVLRNYRADGSLFWNELSVSPVRDSDDQLTHFIGIQKDVTIRMEAEQRLRQRDKELEVANRELAKLATRDSLTTLYNRRYFFKRLEHEWRSCFRDHRPLSVFIADVDHFKEFNDTFGHPAGDECLQRVAHVLQTSFRRPTDVVARYGGEEFIALASGISVDQARQLGEMIRQRVTELQIHGPSGDFVSVSVGVVTGVPGISVTPESLVSAADQELYGAKAAGRNTTLHRHLG